MLARFAVCLAFLLVSLLPAKAQNGNVDQSPYCPVMSPDLAAKAAEEVKDSGKCDIVCKGCGCKGGPGYRGPRGRVGWADLIRTCGPAPHDGCKRECAVVKPGCRGREWLKVFAAGLGLTAGLSFAVSELPDGETPRGKKPKRARRTEPEHGAEETGDDAGERDSDATTLEGASPDIETAPGTESVETDDRGYSASGTKPRRLSGRGAASDRGRSAAPAQ